jgi:preprotein translocase subunit SecB
MTDLSTEIANEAPKGGFAGAEYNAVATTARLEAINLLSNHFTIDPNCLIEQDQWKLSHGRKVLSCHFSDEDHSVAAILQYNVTAKFGRKRALHCTADYGVFYAIPNGATQEAASAFCRNVGTFAAYPYFRALFAQLAGEAGLMLPPLPSIASTAHIPPKKKMKAKSK